MARRVVDLDRIARHDDQRGLAAGRHDRDEALGDTGERHARDLAGDAIALEGKLAQRQPTK